MSATRPAAGSRDRANGAHNFTGKTTTAAERAAEGTGVTLESLQQLRDQLARVMGERQEALQELDEARRLSKERSKRHAEEVARIKAACERLEADNASLRAQLQQQPPASPTAVADECGSAWQQLETALAKNAALRDDLHHTQNRQEHTRKHLHALRTHVGENTANYVAAIVNGKTPPRQDRR